MTDWASLAVIAGTSFTASFGLSPVFQKIGVHYRVLDLPGQGRRLHPRPTPRLGGVAIFLAFNLSILITFLLPISRPPDEATRLVGVFLGALIIFGLGVWDDLRDLPPVIQLALQALAALVVMGSGVVVDVVSNPFGDPIVLPLWISYLFTAVWIIGFVNVLNWLDGVDGLAAGVAAIAGLVLFARSLSLGQFSISLLPLALVGSCLGFLPWNFHPARLFMGSSGAYFLGYALAVMTIIGGAKLATALLVAGIPLLDAAWVIAQRLASGSSPFVGDRSHLHYRLLLLGLSQRQTVFLFYGVCGLFGVLAILLSQASQRLYALLGMALLAGIVLVVLARRAASRPS